MWLQGPNHEHCRSFLITDLHYQIQYEICRVADVVSGAESSLFMLKKLYPDEILSDDDVSNILLIVEHKIYWENSFCAHATIFAYENKLCQKHVTSLA